MRYKTLVAFTILCLSFINVKADMLSDTLSDKVSLDEFKDEYKIRIREAMIINEAFSDSIWEGMSKTPFNLILATDNYEYLVNSTEPYTGFTFIAYDSLLGSNIYARPRVFNKGFLATFPVDKGISTIVVGTPENTSLNGTEWTITLLHEHFHQYQNSQPDYYQSVNDLGLSGGDQSGMWMLNYPFPYDDPEIDSLYSELIRKIQPEYPNPFAPITMIFNTDEERIKYENEKRALEKEKRIGEIRNYFAQRKFFTDKLNEKDYRYFSFQIWQEGLARYTEAKFYYLLNSNNYNPTQEYINLNDSVSLNTYIGNFRNKNIRRLGSQRLSENQRNSFYTLGLFEGLWLDDINPGWRKKYFSDKFFIEKYIE